MSYSVSANSHDQTQIRDPALPSRSYILASNTSKASSGSRENPLTTGCSGGFVMLFNSHI
ncbi:MAG: hypothetical protein A07HR60_01381 [uncultured archaeon A07HR60]|nr:MAG: hypothetical protein A07HR60_01381 [uncultured archaeon A07HR60]